MKRKFLLKIVNVYAVSFMMLSNSFAIASQNEQENLAKAVTDINSSLTSLNDTTPSTIEYCSDCNAMNPRIDCAPESFKALDNIYTNGTIGALNSLFGGGAFKDPRSICNSALVGSQTKPNYLELTKELEKKYPTMTTLNNFSKSCFKDSSINEYIESGRKKTDLELSKAYIAMDFHVKNQKIADENIKLFEAKNQLANLIDVSPSNCSVVRDTAAKKRCEDLQSCNNKKKDELLNAKAEELSVAISSIQKLNEQIKKINLENITNMGIPNTEKDKLKNTLEQKVLTLMELNPALKADEFDSLRNQFEKKNPIDMSKIKNTYIKTLKSSAKKIDERIKELDTAQKCVFGEESKCEKSSKLLAKLNYKDANTVFVEKDANNKVTVPKQLNLMNNFYTCAQSSIESRNSADDVLDDVAVTLAITIATFGAGSIISGGANLLKVASATAKAKNIATLATTGADLLYAGAIGVSSYDKCSEIENEMKEFSYSQAKSCEDITINMYNSSNMSRCYLSAALSTAGFIGAGALAVKFLKVPKNTSAQGNKLTASGHRALASGKVDDIFRESADSAGNIWRYNETTKEFFINGEKALPIPGNEWRLRTASGKIFDVPLNSVDGMLGIAAPSSKDLALSTSKAAQVPNVVPIPEAANAAKLSLTNAVDGVSSTLPRTGGVRSATATASDKINQDINSALAVQDNTNVAPTPPTPATSPTPEAIPADEVGSNEREIAQEQTTPTTEGDPESETAQSLTDLIKFKVSSDDCNTKIKADLKNAKDKHPEISCKYSTCNEEKYKEDKSKCQSEEFEKDENIFDREEKGYYLYPICKLTKGDDVPYSFIKLADNKVKRILISSHDEIISCKSEKEMILPNLVIPDTAPNVGQPNLIQAPSAPILIEY